MLSRVADSIFWMNRYIERAENVARFVDVNLNLVLDVGSQAREQWAPLVATTGDSPLFAETYDGHTQENVIKFLTFDERNPNSILSSLRAARENARTVREMISNTMWEEINKFYLLVRAAARDQTALESPYDFFSQIRLCSHLIDGVTDATMSRGEAWHFGRMGRLIERADKTSRILDVKYYILLPGLLEANVPLDTIQWSALLKSASALEMYRQSFGRITPVHVAEFLILNRQFPRSIHFCLIKAQESLLSITGTPVGTFRTTAEQRLGRLRSQFDYADINEIVNFGLHEFIDGFQDQLNDVGNAIAETFFLAHIETATGQNGQPGRPGQSQSQYLKSADS
ncbi:MAG: alpha-E domain-containing protein [Planctomycetes bacterium]|nr:alpha-E domain-containing protein [Planctomycetota bacterium]